MTIQQQSVSPSEIQKELTQIWDQLARANKMRASLFNLIFYTQKTRRAAYLQNIAQKVIEKFPSRVIFVTVDKTPSEDYLKTAVSVISSSKVESEIACDWIQIDVAGSKQMRVPFLILPHILPDLPVYLVWAEDPNREDPLSMHLEQFATRIIFDSESTENLQRFAKEILKQNKESHTDIADLNWARMESWREMLSSAFYSAERLKHLQRAKALEIRYNSEESAFFCHTRIQSIYLQAWLASQLGWNLQEMRKEQEKWEFIYISPEDKLPFSVSLVPEHHPHLVPGTIISFELYSKLEHHFAFRRNKDFPNRIRTEISTPQTCELPSQYIFAKAESGQSLVKEICHKGTSFHYINVLNLITKMDRMPLC